MNRPNISLDRTDAAYIEVFICIKNKKEPYQLVIELDFTVAGRQILALLLRVFAVWLCGLKFFALAVSGASLDVVELKVDNLVHDNRHNTTRPEGIWRGVCHCILFFVGNSALIILENRISLQIFGEILLPTVRPKLGAQLRFPEIADLPMQFAGHFATLVEPLQFGDLRIHSPWMLQHLSDR